jgi:Na+/H+-dicarboxylate symporter
MEALRLTAREFLLGVIPENVVAAVVRGDLLAVVFFTILLGLAIARLRRSSSEAASVESLHRALETLRQAVSVILHWVMEYAPVGTLVLVAITFGEARGEAVVQFARAIGAVYAGHALIGLLCLVALRASGVRPIQFLIRSNLSRK